MTSGIIGAWEARPTLPGPDFNLVFPLTSRADGGRRTILCLQDVGNWRISERKASVGRTFDK